MQRQRQKSELANARSTHADCLAQNVVHCTSQDLQTLIPEPQGTRTYHPPAPQSQQAQDISSHWVNESNTGIVPKKIEYTLAYYTSFHTTILLFTGNNKWYNTTNILTTGRIYSIVTTSSPSSCREIPPCCTGRGCQLASLSSESGSWWAARGLIRLMIRILHYLKDPKLWELCYIKEYTIIFHSLGSLR